MLQDKHAIDGNEVVVFGSKYSDRYEFIDNVSSFSSELVVQELSDRNAHYRNALLKLLDFQLESDVEWSRLSTKFSPDRALDLPKTLAQKVYMKIKGYPFEDGELSLADNELERILKDYGQDILKETIGALWKECYKSNDHSDFAHFLNCIRNISYYVDADDFLPYAITAVAHSDILIRESGIATFESWDNKEHRVYLEKLADTNISWLDDYKNSVLETMGC